MPTDLDMAPGYWDEKPAYVRKVVVTRQDGSEMDAVEVKPVGERVSGNRHLANKAEHTQESLYIEDDGGPRSGWWLVNEGRGFRGHPRNLITDVHLVRAR